MKKTIYNFIKECKCNDSKPPQTKHLFHWPNESSPWSRAHMDHAYIPKVGLLFILVDSTTAWSEIDVKVIDQH